MKKISIIVLVVFFLTATLSGCAIGTKGSTSTENPTLGQELIDLKKAKDSGAISTEEYEKLKEKLKKSYE